MIVAETVVDGPFEEASAIGFSRVAGYIFGNNRSREGDGAETIAMTAPVILEPQSAGIDMTSSVTMQAGDGSWRLRFFMPSQYALAALPTPTDPTVTITELSAATTAAVRFSGIVRDADAAEHSAALLTWLAENGLTPISPPRVARYSRPTTPPEQRHNEILIDYR